MFFLIKNLFNTLGNKNCSSKLLVHKRHQQVCVRMQFLSFFLKGEAGPGLVRGIEKSFHNTTEKHNLDLDLLPSQALPEGGPNHVVLLFMSFVFNGNQRV